jgi:lipoate-protein ligase A
MGQGWRVVPLEVGEPVALLAEGLRLLDTLEEPTLRWYRASHTVITLGRGQARELAAHGTGQVEVVQRHSGGGAVLLTPDLLSLDVLVPAAHPWARGSPADVFLHVGRAWVAALADLGVEGATVWEGAGTANRRGDARERLLAAVCYATPGRGEVMVGGRKLVGLAQRRRRPGALVQVGMLRRWAPGPLLEALGADPDDAEVAAAAVGIDDLLPHPPDDATVMAAVEVRLSQA